MQRVSAAATPPTTARWLTATSEPSESVSPRIELDRRGPAAPSAAARVRPLDQQHARPAEQVAQPEVVEFVGMAQAVQVAVMDVALGESVWLDQRVRGAARPAGVAERREQSADEGGLARAELARQGRRAEATATGVRRRSAAARRAPSARVASASCGDEAARSRRVDAGGRCSMTSSAEHVRARRARAAMIAAVACTKTPARAASAQVPALRGDAGDRHP